MAPLYSKDPQSPPASFGIAETQQRMRDNNECIRQTLRTAPCPVRVPRAPATKDLRRCADHEMASTATTSTPRSC